MSRYKYRTIQIPEELAHEIDVIVKQRRHGYTSVSEFVKDAIRWYLKGISKSPLER